MTNLRSKKVGNYKAGTADLLARGASISSSDGAAAELNPSARRLVSAIGTAATHISFHAAAAFTGSVNFYA